MIIDLRYYQREAIDGINAVIQHEKENPCAVIPTGGGKTIIFGTMIKEYLQRWPQTRIIVLAHVRELVQQNHDSLLKLWPEAPVGINSASLGQRDTDQSIIFANIQSVYKNAAAFGRFNVVMVDEMHLIPPTGAGMYLTFLAAAREINPRMRVIGFTATPYRLGHGSVIGPEAIINKVAYEVGVAELIDKGYLSKLKTKGSKNPIDTSKLRVRNGEYATEEIEEAATDLSVIRKALDELVTLAGDRRAWLIFCISIKHAELVASALMAYHSIHAPVITSKTTSAEREMILDKYKRGQTRALVNVNVLTTGFDAPHIDCVALLRPTKSAGLYYQMVGRGFRIHPGKEDCLILDFAQNVAEHGPVDSIVIRNKREKGEAATKGEPVRQCPDCQNIQHIALKICEECKYEWPEKEHKLHDSTAGTAPILEADRTALVHTEKVDKVVYRLHKRPGKIVSLRVEYWGMSRQGDAGLLCSEWVCLQHQGYAYNKAFEWWCARDMRIRADKSLAVDLVPKSVSDALLFLPDPDFLEPEEITIDEQGEYPRITKQLFPDPSRKTTNDWGFGGGDQAHKAPESHNPMFPVRPSQRGTVQAGGWSSPDS